MNDKLRQTALKHAFVSLFVGLFLISPRTIALADVLPQGTGKPTTGVELMGDPKKVPNELEGVGIKEHLGDTIDLKTRLKGIDGKDHELGEYFTSGKPTLLNLVYYECPMLCTMVLNGVNDGMRGLDWSIGKEFNVLTVSIDPRDDSEAAKAKREVYLDHYLGKDASLEESAPAAITSASTSTVVSDPKADAKRDARRSAEDASRGWNFFTGDEATIQKLASQLGFEYRYDKIQKQYAHPAVTFVLTPEGKISRYLYGITYRPRDLRLALLEASQGKVGNVFDRLLMFCYHYEPSSRGYTLQAVRVMQAGGAGTVFLLAGYLIVFWTRQRKGKRNDKTA